MDVCSWLLHKEEEEEEIGSQAMQQQLSQIYMLMGMDDEQDYVPAPPLPSSLMLTAASAATTSCHLHPEVSSQIPLSPVAFDMAAFDSMCYQEAHREQARRSSVHGAAASSAGGAFRPYARYLSPRKKPKPGPGACGQRAIKAAMSILVRMHMAKLARCYQMEIASQAPPSTSTSPAGSNCSQLQHVVSERKRREKLNDSFKALRAVLPPASKKDKASILITARDYVNILNSRVSELEERNRLLVESQLNGGDDGGEDDDNSDEKIEIDISRAGASEDTSDDCPEFHLKIVLRSGCGVIDAVAGMLQCLQQRGDVRLVAMNIDSDISRQRTYPRATLTLQLKSSSCDEELLKESVMKAVKDVMQSEKGHPKLP